MTTVRAVVDPPTDRPRCKPHDMVPEWCAWCLGKELAPEFVIVRPFTARGTTDCAAECGKPIEPGQRAAKTAAGTYLHEECAP